MGIRKSDIVFVFPPAQGNLGVFKSHLGVAYLRAALAREGMATAQYLSVHPGTIDAVAADIIRQKSPIVGFTVYDTNAPLCIAIARSIKRQKPGVRVVFGGPTVTFGARQLMEKHAVIDACVTGEAEETASQIFTKLLGSDVLDGIQPGVAFRRGGEVVCTTLPALVGSNGARVQAALDATPSPYLSGILADGRAGVLTGRGCTHYCQYCCFAALGRQRLRLHSIERVVAELEYIAEHRKRTGQYYPVAIHDDAFTLLPSRAKTLCQAIADRKLDLDLSCITRADSVDEELIRLMREAGFVGLAFGLESVVPSVLRAIGKVRPPDWHDPDLEPEKHFVEQVRNSVLTAKKYGFSVGVSLILGLPTETAADGAETLRFVQQLPVDYYTHNFLWVFPGTPLWGTHDKYQIGCTVNAMGLPTTTKYSYDVARLKPLPKCTLERKAHLVRLRATDALYGCDASLTAGKGIGAVVIEAGELSAEVAEWLGGILNVQGMVVQVYPPMKRSEQPLRFYRDRCVLSEHLVPARHHIQLQSKKSNDDHESWRIACAGIDLYGTHKPGLLSITASKAATPLIAWAGGRGTYSMLCELSDYLQQPHELVFLMDRIEAHDTASPPPRISPPPDVKYSGRWLTGKAPCLSLTRIEVDGEGRIRCCRQGKPIGEVGDSLEALSKRLTDFAGEAEQRRGCAECLNMHCPRCPFPGVDDRTYCEIMTKQKRAQRSLNWIRLYSRVPLLVALQQDKIAVE